MIANCLTGMPLALVHERIRSGRRRLLLFQQGGIEEVDLLLKAGRIHRLVLAYNLRMGGRGASPPLERAMRTGAVQVEEMTNFSLLAMLKAGAMGYPFLPVLNEIGATDIVKESGFLGRERFAWAEDPFADGNVLVVRGRYRGHGSVQDSIAHRGHELFLGIRLRLQHVRRLYVDPQPGIRGCGVLGSRPGGSVRKHQQQLRGGWGRIQDEADRSRRRSGVRRVREADRADHAGWRVQGNVRLPDHARLSGRGRFALQGRDAAGCGPTVLITGKAAFRFDPASKEMVLASLHPGRSLEEVASEIPWKIRIARPLETTEALSQKEIDFIIIRCLAPDISMGRNLYAEVLAARVLSVLAKSQQKT